MPSFKDRKFFKNRATDSFRIFDIRNSYKELACAGIQVAGGMALTVYTFDNPTYKILPFMYSAIAIGGAYNVFKILLKNFSSSYIEINRIQSAFELANGAFTYSAGIYAFSEGLKQDDKIWIPSLAIAASGYYFSKIAFADLVPLFNRNPLWLCCQLLLEPALIACATTYLTYFRNHEESYLYWLPFVFTGIIGFRIATDGFSRLNIPERYALLFKVIETMIGSFLLTFSNIVLTLYGLINDFHLLWTVLMVVLIFFDAFLISGSLTCLRRYTGVNLPIFYSLAGMTAGPITFLTSCLIIQFVEDTAMVYFIFISLAGVGHYLFCSSAYRFYKLIPMPAAHRKNYDRFLGPVMTVYSSLVTACICYRMDWRYSLVIAPFIPVGIRTTYNGFRKIDVPKRRFHFEF